MNTERGNVLVIIIGIVFVLFLVGFFRSERAFWDTVNYKKILNLPCGLTVTSPKLNKGQKVTYPLSVEGYLNGCGWQAKGAVAGTVQIFDSRGQTVTAPKKLMIPSDSTEEPFYFTATLQPQNAPTTDTGSILIIANSGLLYSIPVTF